LDTAGPVKKLLPWSIQARERIKTIMEAPDTTACYCTNVGIIPCTCQGNCTSGTGGTLNKSCTDDTKCVANAGGAIRHDQIVGCTGTLKSPIASSIFSINTGVITPCYEDSGGLLADLFTGRQAFRLSQWRGHLPPLEDQYSSFTDYWKAYEEWRGNMCTPTISIGGKDFYVCGDVDPTGGVLSPKYWGTLFQYIPFTSTEDRQGRVYTKAGAVTPPEGYTDQEPGSNVVEVSFKPINQTDLLFFPHTEESLKLGQMLQTTYVPYEWYHSAPPEVTEPQQAPVDSPSSLEYYNTDRCELRDVRTNPGDPLFARQSNTGGLTNVTGDLRFQVRFSCHLRNHYIPSSCYDPCYAQCEQNCIDNHCYNGGVCSSQSDSPACLNCTDVYCPNHCTAPASVNSPIPATSTITSQPPPGPKCL
jgi:hypothetical protein